MSSNDKQSIKTIPFHALSLFLEKNHLLRNGRFEHPSFAGVSGGADSICLLHALIRFPGCQKNLTVLHFNHQTDPDRNQREEEFVRDLAAYLGVGFISGHRIKTGKLASEEGLRAERYRFFNQHLASAQDSVLFLGHHLSDQAETIFMNFFRNRGIRGLLGMNEFRNRQYARPFLSLPSTLIRDSLREQKIPYLDDPSNQDNRYLRNRVRNELSPLIKNIFPPAGIETLPFFARQLEKELRPEIKNIRSLAGEQCRGFLKMSLSLFHFLSPVRQSLIIEDLLNHQGAQWNLPLPPSGNILRSLNRNPPLSGPMGSGWFLSIEHGHFLLYRIESGGEIDERFSPFIQLETLDTKKNMGQNVILPRGGVLHVKTAPFDENLTVWETGVSPSRQCLLSLKNLPRLSIGYTFKEARIQTDSPEQGQKSLNRELKRSRLPLRDRSRLPILFLDNLALWAPGVVPLSQTLSPKDGWGLTLTYFPWKES